MKERTIVLVVAAVQLVNVLDFIMVMPLGPDFAAALDIPTAYIGVLGGAYTASAAATGLLGSRVLDRYDRKAALAVAMGGLAVGTALGGFATGMWTLIAARFIAGGFGGPATAIALAIIADTVPAERRGKAMGIVMSAFSVASILGVPLGLRAAQWLGWQAPFFGVAALGSTLLVLVVWILPPMRAHLLGCPATQTTPSEPDGPCFDPLARASLVNTALVMLGVFAVVPNISAFLQLNLGYPRESIDVLYLIGGLASFFANRVVGSLVDRYGATKLIVSGTVAYSIALYFGFISPLSVGHVLWVFPLLMLSATLRGVPLQTLASRVPPARLRARFMSAQNAIQHLASAAGALGASLVLGAGANGRLIGMEWVALGATGIACVIPFVSAHVERAVAARDRIEPPALPRVSLGADV